MQNLNVRTLRNNLLLCLLSLCALGNYSYAQNPTSTTDIEVAIFAGGCFWCTESDFDKLEGVISTTSGYSGGTLDNPSYEQVSAGGSGHVEAVQVRFDSNKTSYSKLLEAYWPSIDPLNAEGQFCDRGSQYRSVIFYNNPQQQQLAEASKAALNASGRLPAPVVTQILPAKVFYPAEDYHQDYHNKNPLRYNYYRHGCGRDARLEELWKTAQ
jgi:peptide-methionine (S)-S-oxide reductase